MNDTAAAAKGRPQLSGHPESTARLPRQIPYIIGNEACERFSFYGMRNILTPFLDHRRCCCTLPEAERDGIAKEVFHTFVIGVYFFPLLGGWLADRFFGKYNTIFWMSPDLRAPARACLALFDEQPAAASTSASVLIALGSGGIKPLVALVRRRPVRPAATSTSRRGVFDSLLLDHQLRLVLRVAADADLPGQASARAWPSASRAR